jgi:hypothetical protein
MSAVLAADAAGDGLVSERKRLRKTISDAGVHRE